MLLLESIIGIAVGFAIIKWSNEIARWLGQFVGTNVLRDLDNPFVIKIVGITVVASNVFFLLLSLLNG